MILGKQIKIRFYAWLSLCTSVNIKICSSGHRQVHYPPPSIRRICAFFKLSKKCCLLLFIYVFFLLFLRFFSHQIIVAIFLGFVWEHSNSLRGGQICHKTMFFVFFVFFCVFPIVWIMILIKWFNPHWFLPRFPSRAVFLFAAPRSRD